MLGKLIKHELRATAHTMLPLFGLLLLVSGLTNLAMRWLNGRNVPAVLALLFTLILILFSVGMLAVGLVTVVAMVQRFRNNLLRDEGYIMHTLPVSIHTHIWAKVIVAGLWYTLAGAVFVLSAFIVAADAEFVRDMANIFGELLRNLGNLRNVELLAEVLGMLILASIFFSLMIYASLAVGHSLPSRKMLWSNLTFLGLVVATNAIIDASVKLADPLADKLTSLLYNGLAAMTAWRVLCGIGSAYLVVFSAVFYFITVWFLNHRLNLE